MTAVDMPRAGVSVATRTFFMVLWRDIFVTWREIVPFLAQVVIQPFLTLFIFGKVLADLGYVQGNFAAILLPGVVALNGFFGALQSTTMPLVMDFAWTREIEDRLLAPIPIPLVAIEKMIFGAIRGVLSALLMAPVGFLILDDVTWPASSWPLVVVVVVLGSLVGSAIGMVLGTLVPPNRINIMFAIILVPLMFTGSTQFPWRGLENLEWFQVLCALNPLTYVSEAMRAELVPQVPHIPLWLNMVVMAGSVIVFGAIGIKGFMRRALD
ncbi:ABC transporter permease [Kibdelosporangium aridum]|uniref:ABC transporter permease n=1 Tax=Kibdelosporangium aridum TaxID=2030 RepID=UPI000AFE43E1